MGAHRQGRRPAPGRGPGDARRGLKRSSLPVALGALALVLVAGFLIGGCARGLLDFGNPFGEETTDRTGPAVLKSIRNLEDFRAASGHFEVIVDVEQDTRFVPGVVKGERVLFVAVGSVDAGVDFSGLEEGAVDVSDDRRSVAIELPPATFREPELDFERSYVYDRDRGAIDRLQSLFGDDPGDDSELYRLAEEKLAAAARDGSGLLARAERNTRLMLEGLLRALGFTRVEVRFSVADGSAFPTASGVNPMITIEAIAHLNAQQLAARLT